MWPRRTSECWAIIGLEKGALGRKAPGQGYLCSGLTDSGVGG